MNLPQRKTIRLKDYDYSKVNLYFITVCTLNREYIFGQMIRNNSAGYKIVLNRAGEIVNNYWEEISRYFTSVETEEFVIMPNHIHGIIKINDIGDNVGAGFPRPSTGYKDKPSLGQIIAYFKYQSTKNINQISGTAGKQIWQRNYYEHIIRGEDDLQKIRKYIIYNPQKWESDIDNLHIGRGNPAPT